MRSEASPKPTMRVLLVVVIVLVSTECASAVDKTHGEVCNDKDICEEGKGLECFKPYTDCTAGYCLCAKAPLDNNNWDDTANVCKDYIAKGDACTDNEQCNQNSGQECASNVCDCAAETWDSTNKICTGTTRIAAAATPPACTDISHRCVASSGPTDPDYATACGAGKTCACADATHDGAAGCASRLVYTKTATCGAVQAGATAGTTKLCATNVKYPIDSSTFTSIASKLECTSLACACRTTGSTAYVKLSTALGFCKAVGTKNRGATCSQGEHNSCAANLICGKCPETSGNTTTCLADVDHPMKKVNAEACSSDSECDTSVGLKCVKYTTTPACTTGSCTCENDETTKHWNSASANCENYMGTKDTTCYDDTDCNRPAGLTCDGNKKCGCNTPSDWDATSKTCKGGSNKKLVGELCTLGTDECLAGSGLNYGSTLDCDTIATCKCPTGYKVVDGGCVSRSAIHLETCVGTSDNPGSETTGGLCASRTSLECGLTKLCTCPSSKKEWIRISSTSGLCKAIGTKLAGATCTTTDDCIIGYLCFECSTGDGHKCHRGYTSGADLRRSSLLLIGLMISALGAFVKL